MLPNFFISGAPRSGTTYLLACLKQHPDIFMASLGYTGDIHFFDPETSVASERRWDRGLEWYESLFDSRDREKAVGEKTAGYFSDPRTPALIRRHTPQARFITILRNPMHRAYSDFLYHRGEFPITMGFSECCRSGHDRPQITRTGMYYDHAKNYLRFFDRRAFHFTLFDELAADPLAELRKIFRFLEVDEAFVPANYDRKVNTAVGHGAFSRYAKLAGGRIKTQWPSAFRLLKRLPLTGAFEDWIQSRGSNRGHEMTVHDIPREAYVFLSEVYRESDSRMGDLIGRDLISLWHEGT